MLRPKKTFLASLLFSLLITCVAPASGQKRSGPVRKAPSPAVVEPVVSFDTLLADEQYRIYSEVRNVGTLVRSQGFNDLLGPLVHFAEPPQQFSTVLNWIKAHGELMGGSRLCAASWPSKNTLPNFVVAIELASPADAKKLEAELRAFLPKLDPKPKPSPLPSPQPGHDQPENPGMFSQLHIQQVGAVVLLSEKRFSLQDLKPPRRRLLAENPNFVLTRNRFASEPVFVYVDFKAIEKDELKQREKWQQEARIREEQAAANPAPEPSPDLVLEDQLRTAPEDEFVVPPPPDTLASGNDAVPLEAANTDREVAAAFNMIMQPLAMSLFGGSGKYPEALGAALTFEGDSYSVRALLVNSPENRALPVPFIPQLVSGVALTPGSPNVLPGDVDLFVVLSLDYPQIHDGMVNAFNESPWFFASDPNDTKRPDSPFSTLEEKLGMKVKEDFLPLLGNEMALVLTKPQPVATTSPAPAAAGNEEVRSVRLPELLPVLAVSVKDREAVKKLIPRMFESMGLKGAGMLAHTEKRGDAEIVSYGNVFSYALIGDFLVLSPDPALTRRAVDSYVSGDTLSSNSKFKSATRWQGRQIQGQVYLSAELVEQYVFAGKNKPQQANNQPIEPVTYMLSNEGLGPLHEAHVPRGLVQMVVAGLTSKANETPIFTNESIARNVLRTIASAQATFRKTKGDGRYGSLDELLAEGLLTKGLMERYGYQIQMSVLSNRFEVTATPVEYGKTGKRSFYIDESGILRAGDHGGGAATLSDRPINE